MQTERTTRHKNNSNIVRTKENTIWKERTIRYKNNDNKYNK